MIKDKIMKDIQTTFSIKASEIEKKWVLIDAEDKILGRLATVAASILRGKNKPSFTPSLDMGDNVIIINAEKVKLTGTKSEDKDYFRHSLHPGGIKFVSIKKFMEKDPAFVIEHAIKGMLPKTRIGSKQFTNLKVYVGDKHPHEAQKPEKIEL